MLLDAFKTLDAQQCGLRCHLRAVEWQVWPSVIAQPIVPILYLHYSWWKVLVGVIVLNLLWSTVRTHVVSLQLAILGMLFVRLKWVTIPVSAYLFARSHLWFSCLLTLGTPLVLPVLGEITPKPLGLENRISKYFMLQLGYVNRDDPDAEYQEFIRSHGL
jgi:hypothetical protein